MRLFFATAIAATALVSIYLLSMPSETGKLLGRSYDQEFLDLIKASERLISSKEDLEFRYKIYKKNKEFIEETNKRGNTFTLGVTDNALLEFEEFSAKFSLKPFGSKSETKELEKSSIEKTAIDWRGKLDNTPVKNQTSYCNAGYAMSVAGMMEAFVQKYRHQVVPLSSQQIVDCSFNFGNRGCTGGYAEKALDYIRQVGIATEHDYPYMARLQQCGQFQPFAGHQGYFKAYDEVQVKQALLSMPMVVAMEINQELMHYTGGVYTNHNCGHTLNHFALAVGFSENWVSSDYWIIKNSFSNNWGEQGYLRLELFSCGVARNAFNVFLRG